MRLRSFVILIAIILSLITAVDIAAVLMTQKSIGSTGVIKAINVGVFSDSGCTQTLASIDWGMIEPGGSASKTVYVKNIGNAVMTLTLSTSGWVPANAGSYITITWNKQSANLTPNEVTAALITLTVSNTITGITDFSMNIIIQGSG